MTTSLWLRDLGSYAIQLAVIVAAGAVVWRAQRVRHAAVSYAYWRLLLLACLLLPLCQPWQIAAPATVAVDEAVSVVRHDASFADSGAANGLGQTAARSWPAPELLLAGLAAGVGVRGLWLLLGTFGLRRLRRLAQPLEPLPPGIQAAHARLGVRADVCTSDGVTSPITFGFRRPIVIVPPGVLSMAPELQEAIACHELLHVRRRDWLKVMAEEAIRTVFWFHPAIWWLIGRIQLSREHVVDEAVIRLTQSRDRYVEAMLAVAHAQSSIVPAPASLFLRRRFFKRRVAHILQEATMTTRRLIASVTVSTATLSVVAALAIRTFPLEARVPQSSPAHRAPAAPVEIVSGGEQLLHSSMPEYPKRAIHQRVEGEVVLDITIDDRGEVTDARVLSGPDELRRAALESVLQWHYAPERLRSTSAQVTLRFTAPPAGTESKEEREKLITFPRTTEGEPKEYSVNYLKRSADSAEEVQMLRRRLRELENARSDRELNAGQRREYESRHAEIKERVARVEVETRAVRAGVAAGRTAPLVRIKTERISELVTKEILGRAGVAVGDQLDDTAIKRVRDAVVSFDEHLLVRFEPDGKGGLVLVIIAP